MPPSFTAAPPNGSTSRAPSSTLSSSRSMPRSPSLAPAQVRDQVREIYRELAARPIERQCLQRTECCQFQLTGQVPFLTRAEALVAAAALRATGRTRLPEATDGACPLLHRPTRKCLIYADRPFGC